MVRPSLRSRSLKRVAKKTPGGRLRIHYRPKRHGLARCAECKKPLPGVPTGPVSRIRKFTHSKRTVSRPFGGNLCSSCMRKEIKRRAREE